MFVLARPLPRPLDLLPAPLALVRGRHHVAERGHHPAAETRDKRHVTRDTRHPPGPGLVGRHARWTRPRPRPAHLAAAALAGLGAAPTEVNWDSAVLAETCHLFAMVRWSHRRGKIMAINVQWFHRSLVFIIDRSQGIM